MPGPEANFSAAVMSNTTNSIHLACHLKDEWGCKSEHSYVIISALLSLVNVVKGKVHIILYQDHVLLVLFRLL